MYWKRKRGGTKKGHTNAYMNKINKNNHRSTNIHIAGIQAQCNNLQFIIIQTKVRRKKKMNGRFSNFKYRRLKYENTGWSYELHIRTWKIYNQSHILRNFVGKFNYKYDKYNKLVVWKKLLELFWSRTLLLENLWEYFSNFGIVLVKLP